MRRLPGWALGTSGLILGLAGCAAPADESTSSAPPVDPVGLHVSCIDPCTTTYEVRLPATVGNGTYRSDAEITKLVLDAMRARLATRSDIDVDEGRDPTTSANAKQLAASVPSLVYSSSGELTATVRLLVYTYPGGTLLGGTTKRVTMPGVYRIDQTKEDLVISTAATQATQWFIDNLDVLY